MNDLTTNKSYNWDDISVGDYNMNHSENFFARAVQKQEVDQHNCNNSLPLDPFQDENFKSLVCESIKQETNKQNWNKTLSLEELREDVITVKGERESGELRLEVENNHRNEQRFTVSPLKLNFDAPSDNEENINEEDGNSDSGAVKLRQNWSFYNPQDHRNDDAAVAAPKAYNYKDLYQNKREMALRQREEEERKAREFHSRPVPNFKALHKRLNDVVVVHRITVPLTPETLKHSLASTERKKRREQESGQLQADAKGCRKPLVEVKPFQLRADQRVRERREYNESVQNHLVQKKKEQEEERMQREQEEIKEIRKMTEFKARPNPFNE